MTATDADYQRLKRACQRASGGLAASPGPTGLEDVLQAFLIAPTERRKMALRILRGDQINAQLPDAEPYLTLTALSTALGVSTSTLWRWQPPAHDLGGRKRYLLSEVQEYLKSEDFKRRTAVLRAEREAGRTHGQNGQGSSTIPLDQTKGGEV